MSKRRRKDISSPNF